MNQVPKEYGIGAVKASEKGNDFIIDPLLDSQESDTPYCFFNAGKRFRPFVDAFTDNCIGETSCTLKYTNREETAF